MKQRLERGDIIRIEKGMRVIAQVPENVLQECSPFSRKMKNIVIEIGQKFNRSQISEQDMLRNLTSYINDFINVTEEQVKPFMQGLNVDLSEKNFDTSIYEGTYMVEAVILDWSSVKEIKKWKVICHKVNEPNIKVSFYQIDACFIINS